jgi:hypothetical protein
MDTVGSYHLNCHLARSCRPRLYNSSWVVHIARRPPVNQSISTSGQQFNAFQRANNGQLILLASSPSPPLVVAARAAAAAAAAASYVNQLNGTSSLQQLHGNHHQRFRCRSSSTVRPKTEASKSASARGWVRTPMTVSLGATDGQSTDSTMHSDRGSTNATASIVAILSIITLIIASTGARWTDACRHSNAVNKKPVTPLDDSLCFRTDSQLLGGSFPKSDERRNPVTILSISDVYVQCPLPRCVGYHRKSQQYPAICQ